PLSFGQQRLWFFEQLDPGASLNVMSIPVRLTGPLSAPGLERRLTEVVRRHEVLRTCFPALDGNPVQLVLPSERFPLQRIDLSVDRSRTNGNLESEIQKIIS